MYAVRLMYACQPFDSLLNGVHLLCHVCMPLHMCLSHLMLQQASGCTYDQQSSVHVLGFGCVHLVVRCY